MRSLLLAAIRAYQRHLSPRKGFCCAYRHHTGRASCSTLGYRAVRRHGVLAGLALLRRRLGLCGVAYRRFHVPQETPRRPLTLARQRGECDLGCDLPCDGPDDLPGKRALGRACDCMSYCDCGSCDWPERKKKKQADERDVYIPPRRSRPAGRD